MKEESKIYLKLVILGMLSQIVGHPIAQYFFEGELKDTIGLGVIFIGIVIFAYAGLLTARELREHK